MIGSKLRIIRVCRGLDQTEIARKIGVTQNVYSKLENNVHKISDDLLDKLATALGVTQEDIKSPEPVIFGFTGHQMIHKMESVSNSGKEVLDELIKQLNDICYKLQKEREEIQKERDKVFVLLDKMITLQSERKMT